MRTWKRLAAGGIRLLLRVAAFALLSRVIAAQGVTGSLIGTVSDDQGGVLRGAIVRASSPASIGCPVTTTTNEKGQLHIPNLPPGSWPRDRASGLCDVPRRRHPRWRGATIERTVTLR
jgi:hypothetical protein